MRPIGSLSVRRAWASFSGRWRVGTGLLLLGVVVLVPNWIVLPPDDEGVFVEVETTAFQAKRLFSEYPFWNPWIGFGAPHPFSESLVFHPFVLLLHFTSPAFSLGALYQVQLWIAIFSVWAICRHLGIRPWISWLCVITFTLSAANLNYLDDFWPSPMVEWTLSPLLLLCLLKLLDAESRSDRAVYSVSAGLCASLMVLDGHAGVFPAYAIGFGAFLIGDLRHLRRVWPWLGISLVVLALAGMTKAYDIALETNLTDNGVSRSQQIYDMDYASLFLYPLTRHTHDHDYRIVAIGGLFMALTLIGLVHRRVSERHVDGLRLGVLISFLAWYLPYHSLPVFSGNWLTRDPFTLFAIFLAGLTLQRLWDARPRIRLLLIAGVGFQLAVLAAGFYPLYRGSIVRATAYLHGRDVASLKNVFKNQDIYAYFERQPDRRSTRVFMAPLADDRLRRSLHDYEVVGWPLHGLRLVNGHFRGIDMHELVPQAKALHADIGGDSGLATARAALNVLDVGYVLAAPGDTVSRSLVPITRFRVPGGVVIRVYRNRTAWPDAVVVSPEVGSIESLPQRPRLRQHCAPLQGLRPGGNASSRHAVLARGVARNTPPRSCRPARGAGCPDALPDVPARLESTAVERVYR